MTKTKILLCGPPISALGGGPTHIRNLLASPLQRRYVFINFETGSRGIESPAQEEKAISKILRLVTSPVALAWQILRLRPAVVHLNSAMDNRAFWRDALYLVVAKLLRQKVVFQLHGGSLDIVGTRRWRLRLVRNLLALADAVVLLANSEQRDFTALGLAESLVVIPNGVDVRQYSAAGSKNHNGKIRRLAYLGRLMREKGIFESIQALEVLRSDPRFKNLELRIAGSGPAQAELERYIRDHGLGDIVKLVGSVFGEDKVKFLREADLFLFPSYHQEGLPYSILESLAAGTPVVASKVAGIPDVVVNRVHGILVDPKDPAAIVMAVFELAQSEDVFRAMSDQCMDWAAQKLSLERLATQFEDLYERVRSNRIAHDRPAHPPL